MGKKKNKRGGGKKKKGGGGGGPKNKYIGNGSNRNNNRPHSAKDDTMNNLADVQDKIKAEMRHNHHHNNYNDYHTHSNDSYHGGGRKNKKNKNKQYNQKNRNNHNKNKWQKKGGGRSELNQFLDQLRPLGLGIRNARSDGNCLFRAIADQISGDENNQGRFRKEIVEYMTTNSEEFAPFYVGDYTAYLTKMSKNGTWGGNMELTAAAKAFRVDIVIHALNAARYEILYQKGKPERTIHLSYHNERHYASVRRLDDMRSDKPAKTITLDKTHGEKLQREQQRAEIAWCHNGGNPLDLESAKDELMYLTESEQLVVARTGCYDTSKVKAALEYLDGDIEAAVENIMVEMSLMANENKQKIQEQLKKQQEEEEKEKEQKKNKKKKGKKKKNNKGKKNKNKDTENKEEEKKEDNKEDNKENEKEENKENKNVDKKEEEQKKVEVIKDEEEEREPETTNVPTSDIPENGGAMIKSTAIIDNQDVLEERFKKMKGGNNDGILIKEDKQTEDVFSVNVKIYGDDKKEKNEKKEEKEVVVDLDKKNQPTTDKQEKEKEEKKEAKKEEIKEEIKEEKDEDEEKRIVLDEPNLQLYEERDARINAERVNMRKIKCVDCDFESEILLVYISHYRFMHLRGGKKKEIKTGTIKCPCGHINQSDFSFCSECGWDLRYKLELPPDVQQQIENDKKNKKKKNNKNENEQKKGKGNNNKSAYNKPDISGSRGIGRIPADKLLNTGGKSIVIHKTQNKNKNIAKSGGNAGKYGKYNKHLYKYWICKQCAFWNVKSNKSCMVCGMLGKTKDKNNSIAVQSKSNEDYPVLHSNTNNNTTKAPSTWVDLAKNNNKSKQNKQPQQKKKNQFGWICEKCTTENKPSHQKCKMCNNNKPKKGGKKKGNKQGMNGWQCVNCTLINSHTRTRCDACGEKRAGYDDDNDDNKNAYHADPHYYDEEELNNELDSYTPDYVQYNKKGDKKQQYYEDDRPEREDETNGNNKWSVSGNTKCHCGSGKKYKKCCKKLAKHQQDKSYKNKFKNPERGRNDNSYHGNGYNQNGRDRARGVGGYELIDKLDDIIDREETKIAQFRGKKQDKIRMFRELEKTKAQRNRLLKKIENEKDQAIKARNKANRDMQQERDQNKNKKRKSNQIYVNNGGGNNNNNNGNNNNGGNNAAANTVIAI